MSQQERRRTRVEGAQRVAHTVQESSWAAGVPLTRIDWQPNPELEQPDALAEHYLLSLSSNALQVNHEVSAAWLESVAAGLDDAGREELGRLVAELKAQSA